MGDYRQTRNRPVKFVNRPPRRAIHPEIPPAAGRPAAPNRRVVICMRGGKLKLALSYVEAALSRAFRDRAGILPFLLSFSCPATHKRLATTRRPRRNPIKLSRNEN